MKNKINSLFALFGFKPPFPMVNFRKAEKHYADLKPVERTAVDFVHNALKTINNAVRSELKRNGYDPEEVRRGKIRLAVTYVTSSKDERFKSQTYSVDGFVVLRVSWRPNGFTLETNTPDVANYNKKALKSGTGTKRADLSELVKRDKNEANVEALTARKLNGSKSI